MGGAWEEERRRRRRRRLAGSDMRGDIIFKGAGISTEVFSNVGWGIGSSHQQVPDARKARGSQDPTGMTLAEIPNKGEIEPVETISSG